MITEKTYKEKGRKNQGMNKSKNKVVTADTPKKGSVLSTWKWQ